MKYSFFLLLYFSCVILFAQENLYKKNHSIDIQHYAFELQLSDESDEIKSTADVVVLFKAPVSGFSLDLATVNPEGQGMRVLDVADNGEKVVFRHAENRLQINFSRPAIAGEQRRYRISYEGIPVDGLIISKNRHGERTFFGDNYPDRARQWLPVIDHPYDKATVEWKVTAPSYYQVVGNGKLAEEVYLSDSIRQTHWITKTPISTKVMVIGVARFAVQYLGDHYGVPLQTWVYHQDRGNGFQNFRIAERVIGWFNYELGEYPYEKLANVQSKTRYGGMENASNIFYYENSVDNDIEGLVAHEIAHQWFGNSATENEWRHAWLSEGFATYMTDLYMEAQYGEDKLKKLMVEQREKVISYYKNQQHPVVNTDMQSTSEILNINTYQKGAWFLHMLRNKIGEEMFWRSIRTYYNKFRHSTASTDDFQSVVEEITGTDLNDFFQQWLYTSGHPQLMYKWTYDGKNGEVVINVSQQQNHFFKFPLQIGVYEEDSFNPQIHNLQIDEKHKEFRIKRGSQPLKVIPDPNVKLLFESVE